jgi:lysophospholipase
MSVCKKEKFVDNDMIYKASKRMPNCTLVEYEDAWHEILMERDEIRNNFLESFCNLIQEHVVSKPETLKPF